MLSLFKRETLVTLTLKSLNYDITVSVMYGIHDMTLCLAEILGSIFVNVGSEKLIGPTPTSFSRP